jgi:hypothetical protein
MLLGGWGLLFGFDVDGPSPCIAGARRAIILSTSLGRVVPGYIQTSRVCVVTEVRSAIVRGVAARAGSVTTTEMALSQAEHLEISPTNSRNQTVVGVEPSPLTVTARGFARLRSEAGLLP